MNIHEKLNYVEFAAKDLEATKRFFQSVFNWKFVDYGPDYTSFSDQGLDGGFYKAKTCNISEKGGALLVFYSANIEATLDKITEHNGVIVRPIFVFPGGRRFHFIEPSGNEFAVWSEGQ
ncbi:VOC family protein [Aliiglaciecola sp. SL4]|uniref:VOC family protein n=1 Tax=Aliiglaciecola sp. SL4 TaxID=3239806 RepID=UPI00355BCAD4